MTRLSSTNEQHKLSLKVSPKLLSTTPNTTRPTRYKMSSSFADGAHVPVTDAALPRCQLLDSDTKTLEEKGHGTRLCSCGSNPTAEVVMNCVASSPSAPSVSTATETKWYVAASELYLDCFRASASVATAPGPDIARSRWLAASVSCQRKSQTKQLPSFQGAVLSPSGHLPSSRDGVDGSSLASTSADAKARLMRSLTALCLAWRPADWRQLKPCVPDVSTACPQIHVWETQTQCDGDA